MKRSLVLALALLASGPVAAQHNHGGGTAPQAAWTSLPLVQVRPQGRLEMVAAPVNMSLATGVTVVPPKGAPKVLSLEGGRARVVPDVGNYHLARVREDCDSHVATAATALYFSNPGPAPSALLAEPGDGLAILPERLPREHSSFRAGETWPFRVTVDGRPLPGARVVLETANGTRQRLSADLDGRVLVTFPADFPPLDQRPPEVHGQPAGAAFVVATTLETGARPQTAAFNLSYRPATLDGTSPWTGAGFALVGAVLAAPLVRRRRKESRR